jgi:hypothetical protein
MDEERLQLRAEEERVALEERIVHRLDAEPVAREEEGLPAPVPEREGEHPAKALDAGGAPFFPGVHDRL